MGPDYDSDIKKTEGKGCQLLKSAIDIYRKWLKLS